MSAAEQQATNAALATLAATGNSTAMRAFDELSQVANRCSGQRYDGCKDSTAVIVEMGARWEELTANAIEEF